jgi:translation initiation factor IF-2
MKVHELAKKLELTSKELMEKATAMGIEVSSANSAFSDIDAITIENAILAKRNKETETKIVRVAPKRAGDGDEEPVVTVKAASLKTGAGAAQKARPQGKAEEPGITRRPPIGVPVVPKEVERRARPAGQPVPKKSEEPQATVEEAAKAAPEAAPAAPVRETPAAETAIKAPAEAKAKAPAETEPKAKAPAEPAQTPAAQEAQAEAAPEAAKPQEAPKPVDPFPAPRRIVIVQKNQEGKTEVISQDGPAEKPKREPRPEPRPGERRPGGEDRPRRDGPRPDARPGDRPRPAGDRPRPAGDRPRPDGRPGDRPRPETRRPGEGGAVPNRARPEGQGAAAKPAAGAAAAGAAAGKPKTKDKERDKFNKLDKSKKPGKAAPFEPKSLEKKARKKYVKPRGAEVPEEPVLLPAGTKVINVPITVAGFAEQIGVSVSKVIMDLMKLGIVSNINANLDEDTVLVLAENMNVNIVIGKVEAEIEEEGLEIGDDHESELVPRPPIITVMGHVDHGKTSLLDAIRKTNVTASESGGITQHIGASEVEINGKKIVFLDTPGHEAFTAMRARGADVTDIAVLVVAADDSVKPQTVESISHAKAAGVPIIVAVNKMDKPGANPDRVKQDLTEHGVLVEEYGGDVICVPVSAKTGAGIVNLLEMILLQAEVLELRANPDRLAMGTVIEARLDKAKGPVATLLVTNGTLKAGNSVVAGTCYGRIRLMTNHLGETIRKAEPATAVEIIGLTDVPAAGDSFNAVREDKQAREIAERRKSKQREEVMARTSSTTLEELFSQMQAGNVKDLNLIIKGDVQGSVGAVTASLEKLSNENVRVRIVHTGVGAITESDVMLAGTSGSIIIGFNVRPSAAVSQTAEREGVQIRTYRVIYDIINEIEAAMKGMLDPEYKEVVLGEVEIRETFKVPNVGVIGGAYVRSGKVVRNAEIRLIRDGIVIHEGKISSLKRFKDDAKEVLQGFECGIGIANYNDIKEGDIIECFMMQEIERK